MAKKVSPRIGDVFSIVIDNEYKAYFQYICDDYTQVCPHIVRVFRKRFPIVHVFNANEVLKGDILFYVHAPLEHGVSLKVWEIVANYLPEEINYEDFIFCEGVYEADSLTDGSMFKNDPLSHWRIWTVSGYKKNVGMLPQHLIEKVELGRPFTYRSIIERIKLGYYKMTIPEYDILKRKPLSFVHSFLRKHELLDTRQHYWHFLGQILIKEIVLEKGEIRRYSKTPSSNVDVIHDDMRFWEINWEERDFITREEFEKVWEDPNNTGEF